LICYAKENNLKVGAKEACKTCFVDLLVDSITNQALEQTLPQGATLQCRAKLITLRFFNFEAILTEECCHKKLIWA